MIVLKGSECECVWESVRARYRHTWAYDLFVHVPAVPNDQTCDYAFVDHGKISGSKSVVIYHHEV